MLTDEISAGDLRIPRHVAIIMDGNGRWAKKRGLPRVAGHKRGSKAVRRTVEAASELGISMLTLFAFSSENWQRPALEVSALMNLFASALDREVPFLKENSVRLRVLGDISAFGASLREKIERAQQATENCNVLTLNIAANYGGRWDIVQACKKLCAEVLTERIDPSLITDELFASKLCEGTDVDLLIRTGGEKRISNFLMWQASYSELYFSDTLWPDYDRNDLLAAVRFYSGRERRFGKISEQLKEI